MSHKQILEAFRENGGKMTLGYVLQFYWGYKFTSRLSELRRQGYVVRLERGQKPSDNTYYLIEPEGSQMRLCA